MAMDRSMIVGIGRHGRRAGFGRWLLFCTVLCLGIGLADAYAYANENLEGRIRSGLKLFRSLLAADEDITAKAHSNGRLLLLAVFSDDQRSAENFGKELLALGRGGDQGTIRGLPFDVEISNDASLSAYGGRKPAGIYLVQPLFDKELEQIIAYGIKHGVIVYSPFEGHVDKGVLAGLEIETRVRPYINLQTLHASGIRIKPFYLKVAKHYGQQ